MSYRTVIKEPIAERATARLTGVLADETGAGLSSSQIGTMTLTLYDQRTNTILNGKDGIDVKDFNGGSLDDNGNFVLLLDSDDNAIVNPARSLERHVALFQFFWDSGFKQSRHEVEFLVANLTRVP